MNHLRTRGSMKCLVAIAVLLALGASPVRAQSNLKEGNNSFARYTKSKDFKDLEAARKFADEAFKTKRDSTNFRNILLRGLVYSTLAVVDSNRAQKYTADPNDIALYALKRLNNKSVDFEYGPQIDYIRRSLAKAYLIKANRAVAAANYEEAFHQYRMVDSISGNTIDVKHNLAILSSKTGNEENAINRYKAFTAQAETSSPTYILELAELYQKKGDNREMLNTLLTGRQQFPESKEILFTLINLYMASEAYEAVVPLGDEAIAHEPENVSLNYLVGYANEMQGNNEVAKKHYEKVISLDANNFEGNLELGLLYLKEYVANPGNEEVQRKAQEHLLKANQIQPSEVNTLKSLAVLYDQSGDVIQLERVNNILNQLTIN
ncbi:tetratricopeptide repeat protein [Parapedobacter sp. 2B3]|uniref:tetratricopeptide repeat protein n=1 Tax=Parapedobacter sp. 2B3 TaxID=3342381 RepID=UPI0035B5C97D